MNRIIAFVKQVLNRLEMGCQKLKTRSKNGDDTVEAQAQTFRIWMWSSAAGLTLIVITSVATMSSSNGAAAVEAQNETSLLASLPDGYVIAPIDPTNVESLDSIFENHGYADLYRSSDSGNRGACIARGLPLIRAPKNPRRFAVLVPDEQSDVLGELNQPVVVILRKKPAKAKLQVAPEKKRRRGSPLFREPRGTIDLIEEEIPEIAQTPESGAKS